MSLIIKYFSITKSISDGINLYLKNLRLLFPNLAIIGIVGSLIYWFTSPIFEAPRFIFESASNSTRFSYNINTNLGIESFLFLVLLSIVKSFMINFLSKNF